MRLKISLLAISLAFAGACASSVNVEQERQAVLQRDRDWAATTTDVAKFMSFLTADAVVYPAGMPAVKGTAAIQEMTAQMMAAPGFSLKWTPTSAEVGAGGDLAVTAGTFESMMGGSSEKGKYVTAWRKVNNVWMVAHDIFNADAPAVPPHAMIAPASIKWGPAPPSLPPGAQMAVISGDPSQPGPFVIRAQVPAGYRVPPHWHPTTENLTILSGTVALGMGDKYDPTGMTDIAAGGYAVMPAQARHAFLAKTAATFQVHGEGPFAVNYVNAADDPRNAQK